MFRLPVVAFMALVVFTGVAKADANRETLVKVSRDFIIPRYETLAKAMTAQQLAWETFCAAPKTEAASSLQDAYQKAADAWAGIEFVLYGPISTDFRFERMAHWPERQNTVNRALGNLLSRTGEDDLTPERFPQTSAAVQGLTALERLLFEKDAAKALTDGSDAAKRRCAVGRAIARGLSVTSAKVLDEWRRPGGMLATLESGDTALLDDGATRLATDYVGLFDIIDDQKLGAPMGKKPDDAKPLLAEGWRSQRSLRAILINLDAAEAMGKLLVDPNSDEGSSLFYALRTARAMTQGLGQANIGTLSADPKTRGRIVLLRDAVHSLREIAGNTIPTALGVTIGFNSRDGD
ncbi:imelysin family protein [Microvirga flavescens]|uniref:imelysin family protein n=1 Tax=Microvirga flavescens TaxID=2249811 RepID=UPI00130040B7|nr:imelysin family protein [Microvirga flavescens]